MALAFIFFSDLRSTDRLAPVAFCVWPVGLVGEYEIIARHRGHYEMLSDLALTRRKSNASEEIAQAQGGSYAGSGRRYSSQVLGRRFPLPLSGAHPDHWQSQVILRVALDPLAAISHARSALSRPALGSPHSFPTLGIRQRDHVCHERE